MVEIDNEQLIYLFHHLMDSSHIPFDFDSDSWKNLAKEAANRNYRGAVTSIFQPNFSWRPMLQNIDKTIIHVPTRYYQGTTLILERTFTIPVGRVFLEQTWEVAVPFHQHPETHLQTLWSECNWQAKIPTHYSAPY